MKISDNQLTEYITLYETKYGEKLDSTRALIQLNKLITLVVSLIFSEPKVTTLENKLQRDYTEETKCKV